MSDRVFVVRPHTLRLRQHPSTDATILTRLREGQLVARLDLDDHDGWWRVFADTPNDGAFVGYVAAEYLDHWSTDLPAAQPTTRPATPPTSADQQTLISANPPGDTTPDTPATTAPHQPSPADWLTPTSSPPTNSATPTPTPELPALAPIGDASLVWPAAHIYSAQASRDTHQPAAHRLDDDTAPRRDPALPAEERAKALQRIAAWLAPEHSPRYWRSASGNTGAGRTRCNVYAYDFADLAGTYLPRVWWMDDALERLTAGQSVGPVYGQTVGELTANALYRWLETYSSMYGWRKEHSLDTLQHHANAGRVALIAARHAVERSSGHIAMLMPEGSTDLQDQTWTARRDETGTVTIPVFSQAGAEVYRAGRPGTQWWVSQSMAEAGFWVHE